MRYEVVRVTCTVIVTLASVLAFGQAPSMGMLPREAGSLDTGRRSPGGAGPVEPVGSYDDSDAWGWGVAVAEIWFCLAWRRLRSANRRDRSCISQARGYV